jgi:hypothetical protein
MSPQIKPRNREPAILAEDDVGFTASDSAARMREQDEGFCDAMRHAIYRKKENVLEGIKKADPHDGRVLRSPSRVTPFIASACSLENQ